MCPTPRAVVEVPTAHCPCMRPVASGPFLSGMTQENDGLSPKASASKRRKLRKQQFQARQECHAVFGENATTAVVVRGLNWRQGKGLDPLLCLEDIRAHFEQTCGVVVDLIDCPSTARGRCAFVRFESIEAVYKAMTLSGSNLGTGAIDVYGTQGHKDTRGSWPWDCSSCDSINPEKWPWCHRCGTDPDDPLQRWKCRNCDKLNDAEVWECSSCAAARWSETLSRAPGCSPLQTSCTDGDGAAQSACTTACTAESTTATITVRATESGDASVTVHTTPPRSVCRAPRTNAPATALGSVRNAATTYFFGCKAPTTAPIIRPTSTPTSTTNALTTEFSNASVTVTVHAPAPTGICSDAPPTAPVTALDTVRNNFRTYYFIHNAPMTSPTSDQQQRKREQQHCGQQPAPAAGHWCRAGTKRKHSEWDDPVAQDGVPIAKMPKNHGKPTVNAKHWAHQLHSYTCLPDATCQELHSSPNINLSVATNASPAPLVMPPTGSPHLPLGGPAKTEWHRKFDQGQRVHGCPWTDEFATPERHPKQRSRVVKVETTDGATSRSQWPSTTPLSPHAGSTFPTATPTPSGTGAALASARSPTPVAGATFPNARSAACVMQHDADLASVKKGVKKEEVKKEEVKHQTADTRSVACVMRHDADLAFVKKGVKKEEVKLETVDCSGTCTARDAPCDMTGLQLEEWFMKPTQWEQCKETRRGVRRTFEERARISIYPEFEARLRGLHGDALHQQLQLVHQLQVTNQPISEGTLLNPIDIDDADEDGPVHVHVVREDRELINVDSKVDALGTAVQRVKREP